MPAARLQDPAIKRCIVGGEEFERAEFIGQLRPDFRKARGILDIPPRQAVYIAVAELAHGGPDQIAPRRRNTALAYDGNAESAGTAGVGIGRLEINGRETLLACSVLVRHVVVSRL